jgi:hypothetical protein
MVKKLRSQSDIETQAIKLLSDEKQQWEDETCFVTEKVAFRMRELLKTLAKNYWGIFDKPTDPTTGREKIWVPLTESICDSVVKNIDLDTKDINFRAKKTESIGYTAIVRSAVKNYLDDINFGEYLDNFERDLAIFGTAVWKTMVETDDENKQKLCIEPVNLLNFYIDPTATCIREAVKQGGVIERSLWTPDAVRKMGKADGWVNLENLEGVSGLSLNDADLVRTNFSSVKLVELFERWGMFSKFLITGNEKDREHLVFGRIVASNLVRGGKIHVIEERKMKDMPYEEAWYSKVNGRWYGRGPAEKVMMLQIWMNTIVNIRINRSYVSQLGIFKIRKGSGITPQMLSRLPANGAVTVSNPDDLTQMVIQEASQASYSDESNIQNWAQRVTSVFESVTGESLPSSTPATNAAIQSRAGQSQFTFVKEGIGMFLQRWVKAHVLPYVAKQLRNKSEVIRLTGEVEELREMDAHIANELLYKHLKKLNAKGEFFDISKVEAERQRILDRLGSSGSDRYVQLDDNLNPADYDVQVFITNEEMDKAVLAQNLVTVLQTIPNLPNSGIDPTSVVRSIMDVMGIDATQLKARQLATPQQGQGQPAPGQPPQPPQGQPPAPPAGMPGMPPGPGAIAQANTL